MKLLCKFIQLISVKLIKLKQKMSNSSIVDWLIKLGIKNQLNSNDILSGNTANLVMKKTIQNYKSEFVTPSTAINKMNNWNNIIKNLQKNHIIVSQDQKNKILHGNQTSVYNIISDLKLAYEKNKKEVQVDINKIDHRADPKQSKSLLELFILVIIKNLGLNAKQSVALLSNDSKYLAHILAKGFKEQSKPVHDMLLDFQKYLPKIQQFCQNKENETFFLKSLKPGLISKFLDVSILTLQILMDFTILTQSPFETFKNHLISTLILQYRRHNNLLSLICKSILSLTKYNKHLFPVIISNTTQKQLLIFYLEFIHQAEEDYQLKTLFAMNKNEEILNSCVDGLNSSQNFGIAVTLLLKLLQANYAMVTQEQKTLVAVLNNLQHLALHKRVHITIYINSLFGLLDIFGKRKNSIAPLFFKLIIQKYKLALNEQQSQIYTCNLLNILQVFPSIPSSMIIDAIIQRYNNSKSLVCQLQIEFFKKIIQEDQMLDEQIYLKIYNLLSKVFLEDIYNSKFIGQILLRITKKNQQNKKIGELSLKMIKVCLAVHYANLRKLNLSKSIIEGVVKLDQSNSVVKAKNLDIQYFINSTVDLQIKNLNHLIQPLLAYSYIQSLGKAKSETQGLGKILQKFGNLEQLIKKYEQDAKTLHQQRKKSKKTLQPNQFQQQDKTEQGLNSDLNKKKNYNTGSGSYSLYLSKISKIPNDAQKGLQKYQKVYLEKINKQKLEQKKKNQEEQKMQNLHKQYTKKIAQKGILVNPKVDQLHQYLFQFDVKQKELAKQKFHDFSTLPIFNPDEQQQSDLKALQFLLKKYHRVLKLYYSTYGGKLRPNTINYFDQIAEKNQLMQVANVWKLFKDHFLDEFISIKQANYIVQRINGIKKKSYTQTTLLDFQAFEDFIVHSSIVMFSRPPKDLSGQSIAQMVQQTFYRFKLYATQNKIDSRLFEQQRQAYEDNSTIKKLNQQLLDNQNYILPQGFKKITQKRVDYIHEVSLLSFAETYADVLDVLDLILFQKFNFHILQPYTDQVTDVYAKPALYKKKQQPHNYKQKYLSVKVKKVLEKYSNFDRNVARQAAIVLNDIIDSVQQGKDSISSKSRALADKKALQDQKKQLEEQEKKKRQRRDRQVKRTLEKHQKELQQKKQSQKQKRDREQKKQLEQKRKRQKYEKDLKQKVNQYQQQKKFEKKKEEQQKQKQKKKQQEQFERKKKALQQTKKMLQETKQKKAEEEKKQKQEEAKEKKKKEQIQKKKRDERLKQNKKLLEERKQKLSKSKVTEANQNNSLSNQVNESKNDFNKS